ncbi:hypothetical protein [Methanobacterium petrolearium]|uniref:hypothetical protein n=1 Tax=Methanobacterium petrolearium TaxID=710190 RepID=UPI001AE1C404|nr:hypothetical protein [Methanobacterium petrolearium]MBP1944680.1 hypothetical protein [Methanobacterium petrolearium]BDZ69946.1 hypothetical protein GCM10025861_04630 [Methanobacterium petrolearium]
MDLSLSHEEKTDHQLSSLLMRVLEGYTIGLCSVLGEGVGGVTQVVGKDIWYTLKQEAENREYQIDSKNPKKALNDLFEILNEFYKIIDNYQIESNDNSIKIKIKGCKFRDYTDKLENKGIKRQLGCPVLIIIRAMLKEVRG